MFKSKCLVELSSKDTLIQSLQRQHSDLQSKYSDAIKSLKDTSGSKSDRNLNKIASLQELG